jgi:hypothetical protein
MDSIGTTLMNGITSTMASAASQHGNGDLLDFQVLC